MITIYINTMLSLKKFLGFDWDESNQNKNWLKHKALNSEGEQAFLNQPLLIMADPAHSQKETRYYALGRTDANRLLFISFTARADKIRIISARDMSRKEREQYGKS